MEKVKPYFVVRATNSKTGQISYLIGSTNANYFFLPDISSAKKFDSVEDCPFNDGETLTYPDGTKVIHNVIEIK